MGCGASREYEKMGKIYTETMTFRILEMEGDILRVIPEQVVIGGVVYDTSPEFQGVHWGIKPVLTYKRNHNKFGSGSSSHWLPISGVIEYLNGPAVQIWNDVDNTRLEKHMRKVRAQEISQVLIEFMKQNKVLKIEEGI